VGWGEATPVVGRAGETVERINRLLGERTEEGLQAPEDVEGITAEISQLPEDASAARYGLELALLDWLARREQRPVAQLLSNQVHLGDLRVNALLASESTAELLDQAIHALEAGFDTLKVKVGALPLDDDLARLAALRDRVGPGTRIRIDANGGWSEAVAARALRELRWLDIELCEQPVAEQELATLDRLAAMRLCPVAADESVPRLAASATMGVTVRLWVLKPSAVGGLLASLRLAGEARRRGVECYVTAGWEGRVARMGALHLAAALPGADRAHGLATGEWIDGIEGEPRPVRGCARLPQAHGLGVEGGS
jgi:L-alanine-DL-glutamate epimerase-like enolase superfamily enzyme